MSIHDAFPSAAPDRPAAVTPSLEEIPSVERAELKRRITMLRTVVRDRRLAIVTGPGLFFERPLPASKDLLVALHRLVAEGPLMSPAPTWIEALGLPLDVDEPLMLLAELVVGLRGHGPVRRLWIDAISAADPVPTHTHHLVARLTRLGCARVASVGWDGTLGTIGSLADDEEPVLLQGSIREPESLVITALEHREAFGADGRAGRWIAEAFREAHVLLVGLEPDHVVLRTARPGPLGASYVRCGPVRRVDEVWAAMGWTRISPAEDTESGTSRFVPWLVEQAYGDIIPDQVVRLPSQGSASASDRVPESPSPTRTEPPLTIEETELGTIGASLQGLAANLGIEPHEAGIHLGMALDRCKGTWPALVHAVHAGASPEGEGRVAVATLLQVFVRRFAPGNSTLQRMMEALERGDPITD